MLRILVAEDSPVIQRTIIALLESEPGIRIVGTAATGREAVEQCRALRPDLVTMDIFMPEMDGLEATRQIMEECPTRIVIVTSMVDAHDLRTSFDALRAGAVEIIEKPHGVLRGNYAEVKVALSAEIRRMSAARPLPLRTKRPASPSPRSATTKRRSAPSPGPAPAPALGPPDATRTPRLWTLNHLGRHGQPEIICIGGSTGAPAVLQEILAPLPSDYPIPIVVAQHIAMGFGIGLVSWLDETLNLSVRVATRGSTPQPGQVLLAPDDRHLELRGDPGVTLHRPVAADHHIPSVDRLFASAARRYGSQAVGLILSGMGQDGAQGLGDMRSAGALTIGQAEPSCVVYGMPMAARDRGAVSFEASPPECLEVLRVLGRERAV